MRRFHFTSLFRPAPDDSACCPGAGFSYRINTGITVQSGQLWSFVVTSKRTQLMKNRLVFLVLAVFGIFNVVLSENDLLAEDFPENHQENQSVCGCSLATEWRLFR